MDMVALPISARCRNNAPLLQLQFHATAVPRAQFCPPCKQRHLICLLTEEENLCEIVIVAIDIGLHCSGDY
jgi:hypothetical protein